MSRGGIIASIMVLAIVIGVGVVVWYAKTRGFSATGQPSRPERFIAHRLLELSYPASAKSMKNPVPDTPAAVEEGRRHYSHDCAGCHGDDGLGHTEIGRGLYPKPPNLRHESDMPDGELFYIIRNGVRFTGMPGWMEPPDDEIWKLVLYIRALPNQPAPAQAAEAQH
jgi:mono/diheme cytochrome c family protein